MEPTGLVDQFARNHLPPLDQWPVLLLDNNPDIAYPKRLNAAVELLSQQVHNGFGDHIALEWLENNEKKHVTYRELDQISNQIAHVFVEDMGLVSGNRILLRGPNNLMMAASWLAALKAGLVTVPTMPLLRAVELKTILDKAEVQAAVCDQRLAEELNYCMDPEHPHYSPFCKRLCFLTRIKHKVWNSWLKLNLRISPPVIRRQMMCASSLLPAVPPVSQKAVCTFTVMS